MGEGVSMLIYLTVSRSQIHIISSELRPIIWNLTSVVLK